MKIWAQTASTHRLGRLETLSFWIREISALILKCIDRSPEVGPERGAGNAIQIVHFIFGLIGRSYLIDKGYPLSLSD